MPDPTPAPAAGQLSPAARQRDLARLEDEVFDVLVIGGGVTGAGVALDAVTRGMAVALVEARDLASGTSSRSSKLIHGGLRYLEHLEFRLVREALRERHLLLERLAPHLVRPVPFVYPLTRRALERPYIGAGLALYDALGGGGPLPRHRHLSHRRLLELVPGLRPDAAVGGLVYHDAQVDDARFTVALARTAAAAGAAVLTGTPVVGITRSQHGRIDHVRVHDTVSGRDIAVRARHVIGAAGAWNQQLQELVGGGGLKVRTSKGVHVTVPREAIASSTGLITRTPRSVLFVIPWRDRWLLGTTDTPWEHDLAHPTATRHDVDAVLAEANRWLARPLGRGDVVSAIAGLRPLLDTGGADSAKLSREHAVTMAAPGMSLIAGGKFTTYRVMAADAVDVAARAIGIDAPSRTADVPLLGAAVHPRTNGARAAWARRWGIEDATARHLLERHGGLAAEVLELTGARPELAEPLDPAGGYLAAEVVAAAAHEAVLHLDDVLTRRTRIALEWPDRGAAVAATVADLVGDVLGWSPQRRATEVASYRARLAAERAGEAAGDDATASAARGAWRDPRLQQLV